MNEFCDNPHCESPGFKEVPVSVEKAADQKRTLCAPCEETYSWGVQHGTFVAEEELGVADLARVDDFLQLGGFVVVGKNREDPASGTPLEAWAYKGPPDFASAASVTFGLGVTVQGTLKTLGLRLGTPRQQPADMATRSARTTERPLLTALLNERELATVLAALRFHQDENLQGGAGIPDEAIRDIASDGGRLEPLNLDEVGRLCERLNLDPPPDSGLTGAGPPSSPSPALQRIHDLLYLDIKDGREFYNPDKEWNEEILKAIADVVAEYVPRPRPASRREPAVPDDRTDGPYKETDNG